MINEVVYQFTRDSPAKAIGSLFEENSSCISYHHDKL